MDRSVGTVTRKLPLHYSGTLKNTSGGAGFDRIKLAPAAAQEREAECADAGEECAAWLWDCGAENVDFLLSR